LVCHSAGVEVIATATAADYEETAASTIAGIVGARVEIVADNGIADTFPRLAVVGHRADVTIFAFNLVEGVVGTTSLSIAEVFSAVVAVVAQRDQQASLFFRLVNQSVAIFICAITGLGNWHCCIAVGEALFSAHPLARAKAEFALQGAGCPQRQGN
jgi:hypothetical protein